MKIQFFPANFMHLAVWLAKDGTPMQCNLLPIIIIRDGVRQVIEALFACDGCSSPFLSKYARRSSIPHDYAFWHCTGWWAANLQLFRDMREIDGRGILLAGAFWLALTLWPWAYIRHMLRRSKIGRRRGWFLCDEARRIIPEGVAADAAALAARYAKIQDTIRFRKLGG